MDEHIQALHARLSDLPGRTSCSICGADDWYERVQAAPFLDAPQTMHIDTQLGTILRICRRCGVRQSFTALLPTVLARTRL